MKYRPTILNLVSGILFIWMIIEWIKYAATTTGAGGEAWGGVAIISLLSIAVLGLVVDFIVQLFTRQLSIKLRVITRNLVGILVLSCVYYLNRSSVRHLTLTVPNEYENLVAMVSNVPKEKRLKTNLITLNKKATLPASGIIYTSSKMIYNDLVQTKFKTKNGQQLSIFNNSIGRSWANIIEYDCNNEIVQIRVYNLGSREGQEQKIDTLINQILDELKNKCPDNF